MILNFLHINLGNNRILNKFKSINKRYVGLFFLLVIVIAIASYSINNQKPTFRGSLVSYISSDRYSKQDITLTGRIIALPGELIRFNLHNGQIYIKQNDKAYRLKENYVPANTYTSALMFNDGWYQLKNDQLFVLKDNRNIGTMSDFIYEDNVINQNQIIQTQKKGKRSDIKLIPIDEAREFALQLEKGWEAWQTQVQVSDHINLKNNATPILYKESIYVPTSNNRLVAIDAINGHKKWEINFTNTIARILPEWDDNLLFVSTTDNKIHSITKENGTQPWEVEGNIYTQLPNSKALDTFINFSMEKLSGYDKKTGKVKWYLPLSASDTAQPLFKLIDDNLLVYTNNSNKVYLLKPGTGVVIWELETQSNVSGIVENQNLLIITDGFIWGPYSQPEITNDSPRDTITVIDKTKGNIIWSKMLDEPGIIVSTLADNNALYTVERFVNRIVLAKRDINSGKLLWQHISRDMKYFPSRFELHDHYLVGSGGYGGNYIEDVPYKMSVFVFNADSGKLTLEKGNLGYANFEVASGKVLIFDKIIEAYNLSNGKMDWSSAVSGDVGTSWKPWVANDDKNAVFVADKHKVISINTQDGKELWSTDIESTLQSISIKNGIVYFLDQGKKDYYALDSKDGHILWQTRTLNPSSGPHIASNGRIFTKNIQSVKLQFTQITFEAFDPQTNFVSKIFDRITNADNDLVIEYGDSYIYVFVDDFVTAIKYQSN